MNNFKRGFINIIIATSFILLPISSNAGYTGTPNPTDDPSIIRASCSETTSMEYDPIGDTRGASVYTKRKAFRDCNITKLVEGECIKWEEDRDVGGLGPDEFNVYEDNKYEDSLGSLLAMLGAYDQMEHLWSGFKGYCTIGTKQDFEWASDPMFWSSMALSYFMSSAQGQEAMQSAVDEGVEVAKQAGITISSQTVRCMVTAAVGVVSAGFDYFSDESDQAECDPVDEICASDDEATSESEIITMDRVEFDDMVAQVAADGENTDLYDYIYMIDDGPEIVSFRLKHINEMEGVTEADMEAMNEMKEELKEFKLYLGLAMTAASLAACSVTGGAIGNQCIWWSTRF